jgi:iron complex transport system substrate-binding protein
MTKSGKSLVFYLPCSLFERATKKRGFFVLLSKIFQFLILVFALIGANCQAVKQAPSREIERREIADDLGRKVQVTTQVERVVSLAPNLTEAVFAVGAGAKLVGRTSYCNFPAEAKSVPIVGDTLNPSLETIVAAKPDLILLSTDSQLESFLRQTETRNIPVFVADAKNFDGVLNDLQKIGELLDRRAEAEKLNADLRRREAAIREKIKNEKPIRVFVQISREPLYTIGKDSFLTDVVRRAGGESVTAGVETAYPKISRETALSSAPEAIFLSYDDSMGMQNAEPDEAFKNSPAVKNKRIFRINGDLMTRPSPRIVDLIEQMARSLHPNVF